jgi:hypothetical protein
MLRTVTATTRRRGRERKGRQDDEGVEAEGVRTVMVTTS